MPSPTAQSTYLLEAPTVPLMRFCPLCGRAGAIEKHHPYERGWSVGMKDEKGKRILGPTHPVCKNCHSHIHDVGDMWSDYWGEDPGWVVVREVVDPVTHELLEEWDEFTTREPLTDVPYNTPTPEEGGEMFTLLTDLRELRETGHSVGYYEGVRYRKLAVFFSKIDDMREWLRDQDPQDDIPSAPTISRFIQISRLPEGLKERGTTRLYNIHRAAKRLVKAGMEWGEAVEFLAEKEEVMLRTDFAHTYLGAKAPEDMQRHACPDCGRVHVVKGE